VSPDTSIILINKGDRRIADSLDAIERWRGADSGKIEVIVVDGSEHRLDDIAARFPEITWIPFSPIPGRVTIPHQRNVGLSAASGETIVFTDAGCIPDENWLELLTAPIELGAETVVAGSHRSPNGDSLRDEDTARRAGLEYLAEAPTINLAIRRQLIEEIGGFDERFDYGSDVDLCWRLIDSGERIRYVPEASVAHDWGATSDELRRTWVYGRARARLFLKHRHRWRNLLGEDSPLLVYPLYLLFLPVLLRRPRLNLMLLIPLYRNRGRRPVLAIADHFIRGAAAMYELAEHVSRRSKSA
jgi:GT2 family glycosyltransferase